MHAEVAADIMAVFGQYDIDGLGQLHPRTVAALYQQAHRIEQRRFRQMVTAGLALPKMLDQFGDEDY